MNVLFVCSRNRLRSPTAEMVFAEWRGVDTDSAGTADDAEVRLSADHIEWADIVFVMEKQHRARIAKRFRKSLGAKRIVCLDIPDDYGFMQPELVELLERKAGAYLRH